jgi:hypothetical protein
LRARRRRVVVLSTGKREVVGENVVEVFLALTRLGLA